MPGITGWAQVNSPYGASEEDALEKLQYDLYYLKNMSALLDLHILLRTIIMRPNRVGSIDSWYSLRFLCKESGGRLYAMTARTGMPTATVSICREIS
jgi:hypothetical protein